MGCGASKKYALVANDRASPPVPWICKRGVNLFETNFENKTILGKGKFGIVALSLCAETKSYVAVKYIPKDIILECKAAARIRQEIEFVKLLKHPFIIPYFGEFATTACVAMVFQYAPGGEFFTRMKKQNKMPESHAMFYFGEIALALKYLHGLDIVYRDLKPENLLLDEHGHIQLCDFGFASSVGRGDNDLHDFCGTAMYISPEIAAGGGKTSHGAAVDWWAAGVVLYEMLAGTAPFGDSDNMSKFEIFNNINTKSPSMPMGASSKAKALVSGLLTKDSSKRFSWRHVSDSSWLEQMDWTALLKKRIPAPWIPKLGRAGDSSHFVDWSKVSVPIDAPSEDASKYCQGIAYTTGKRRASVQGDLKTAGNDSKHSSIPASQRNALTRRGSTGSFDRESATMSTEGSFISDSSSGMGRKRSSVGPSDSGTFKRQAPKLKKRNTSSDMRGKFS